MTSIVQTAARFRDSVSPDDRALYERLARDGQQPRALIVSCSDSRVVPEHIVQAGPGELFVCRNAGNIVPSYGQMTGGVTATVEYAVAVLGVRDVVVCGHSGCGAMHALMKPESLDALPAVRSWLLHGQAARAVVCEAYPQGLDEADMVRALAMENVVLQLNHLRTHPAVAARVASGQLSLHGWFFDVATGEVLALDGAQNRFVSVRNDADTPVAVAPTRRAVAAEQVG